MFKKKWMFFPQDKNHLKFRSKRPLPVCVINKKNFLRKFRVTGRSALFTRIKREWRRALHTRNAGAGVILKLWVFKPLYIMITLQARLLKARNEHIRLALIQKMTFGLFCFMGCLPMSRSECLWSGGIFSKCVYCSEKTLKHLLFQKIRQAESEQRRMVACFNTCFFFLRSFFF